MFAAKNRNLVLIIVILAGMLAVFAAVLFLNLETDTVVLAQEGGLGSNKGDNAKIGGDTEPSLSVVTADSQGGDIGTESDGSGIEVVPIGAFKHNGNNANDWFHDFSGGYIENTSTVNDVCLMAPTYPPDGATLTRFEFALLDDSLSEELFVYIKGVELATGSSVLIGGGAASLDSATPTVVYDPTLSPASVSNSYAYYVTTCIPANTQGEIQLYGARLFYTPAP